MSLIPPPQGVVPRRRIGSILVGLLLTGAFVAGGAALTMWAIPPAETPSNVARNFIEAQIAHDWSQVWTMMCESNREKIGDYYFFTEGVEHLGDPPVVDLHVETGDVRLARNPVRSYAAVMVDVWHDERDRGVGGGELLVALEDGALRVCDDGPWRRPW